MYFKLFVWIVVLTPGPRALRRNMQFFNVGFPDPWHGPNIQLRMPKTPAGSICFFAGPRDFYSIFPGNAKAFRELISLKFYVFVQRS